MTDSPRIRVDLKSPVPVYRQIIEGLRVLLVEGRLRPGTELPSVRRLALDLGIHFNTVGEAYRQLAEEGWLDLRHGRKAVVLDRDSPQATSRNLQDFRSRLSVLIAEARANGLNPEKVARELTAVVETLK